MNSLHDECSYGPVAAKVARVLILLGYASAIAFACVFVWRFTSLLPLEVLSNDAQGGALPRWVNGDTLGNLAHHNTAQAIVQMFFLVADVSFGPYPYWSRTFNLIAWIVFFISLRTAAPTWQGHVMVLIGIVAYFCFKNAASTINYPWVHVEVSSQILSLACCLFAAKLFVDRSPNRVRSVWLLGLGCFVFSHAHKGFYFPLLYFPLMAALAEDKKQRLLLLLATAFYVLYIAYLDGFLYGFYLRSKNGPAIKQYSLQDNLLAIVLLGTALVGSAAKVVSLSLIWLRIALFVGGLLMAADSLRRIVLFKDARFAPSVFLILPAVGAVVTTVAGRFEELGFIIQEGERYWYSSIFFLLGMLSYLAQFRAKAAFVLMTIPPAISALVLAAVSFERQDHLIRYEYNMQSMHLALAYDPEADWLQQAFTKDVANGFRRTRQFLKNHKAEVFSSWELAAPAKLSAPPPDLADCLDSRAVASREIVGPNEANIIRVDMPKRDDLDLAVLWDGETVLSLGYVLKLAPRYAITVYSRKLPADARLAVYHRDAAGTVSVMCQIKLPTPEVTPASKP